MRSPDELAARARQLWARVSPSSPQPVTALETFEAMAQLRLLTWLLEEPLDALLEPDQPAPSVPDELTAEQAEEVERYATLVTSPVLRSFGRPNVLALALPPLLDPHCGHPTVSTFVSRPQAHQLRELVIPDPWGSASPGASARVLVPAQARKSAS